MSSEPTILKYTFDEIGLEEVSLEPKGQNWPVVYLIYDEDYKNLYIGETSSAYVRMGQHLKNEEKKKLKTIAIVFDNWYNKSVILDYEQRLIKYCSVDKKFKNILNRNKGQQADHDYYYRDHYRKQFRVLWKELRDKNLAEHSLEIIENDNIFKFSPYNSLTGEQNEVGVAVMDEILDSFSKNQNGVSLVNGCAGTGKTVLAISIINSLVNAKNIDDELLKNPSDFEDDIEESKKEVLLRIKEYIKKERNGKSFKIGFVFPMPGIRKTVQRVFKECENGLAASMVIGPNNVVNENYDILFVDESHRLSKRKNLTGFASYDETSKKLGLNPENTNQLEWILKSAKHVVLFYDEYQSVKSSDITHSEYQNSLNRFGVNIKTHKLETQMRCGF